jgi:hypothetical protein
VICVPESQLGEAQTVFDRFLKRDNLDNYCYTDKYPEIYDKLSEHQSQLKPDIERLRELLEDFDHTFTYEGDLSRFVNRMTVVLAELYVYGGRLPHVVDARDGQSESGTLGRDQPFALPPDGPFKVYDPSSANTGERSLIDLLLSIRESTEESMLALSSDKPDAIATAVNDLRFDYWWGDGWGRDLLLALLELHHARAEMRRFRPRLE